MPPGYLSYFGKISNIESAGQISDSVKRRFSAKDIEACIHCSWHYLCPLLNEPDAFWSRNTLQWMKACKADHKYTRKAYKLHRSGTLPKIQFGKLLVIALRKYMTFRGTTTNALWRSRDTNRLTRVGSRDAYASKIHFGSQSLTAVGHSFQKIYYVLWSTDAL